MARAQSQQDNLGAITLAEIVRSPEWELVESVLRSELQNYMRQITNLDPFDTRLAQKSTALSAKIHAIKALNRRFYRDSGLEEAEGEERLTGGNSSR